MQDDVLYTVMFSTLHHKVQGRYMIFSPLRAYMLISLPFRSLVGLMPCAARWEGIEYCLSTLHWKMKGGILGIVSAFYCIMQHVAEHGKPHLVPCGLGQSWQGWNSEMPCEVQGTIVGFKWLPCTMQCKAGLAVAIPISHLTMSIANVWVMDICVTSVDSDYVVTYLSDYCYWQDSPQQCIESCNVGNCEEGMQSLTVTTSVYGVCNSAL